MKTKPRDLILTLLVLLPALFPYASRCQEVPLSPLFFGAPVFLFFIGMLFYWCLVGHLFARWVGSFGRSFFLGNLPVFLNVCGEWVYYVMLRKNAGEMPVVACLIGSHGSHIDKICVVGHSPGRILVDAGVFLVLFIVGYEIKKHRIGGPYPAEGKGGGD